MNGSFVAGVACQIEEAFMTGFTDRIEAVIFASSVEMGRIHGSRLVVLWIKLPTGCRVCIVLV